MFNQNNMNDPLNNVNNITNSTTYYKFNCKTFLNHLCQIFIPVAIVIGIILLLIFII